MRGMLTWYVELVPQQTLTPPAFPPQSALALCPNNHELHILEVVGGNLTETVASPESMSLAAAKLTVFPRSQVAWCDHHQCPLLILHM